jgi:hypothetical protein
VCHVICKVGFFQFSSIIPLGIVFHVAQLEQEQTYMYFNMLIQVKYLLEIRNTFWFNLAT